jgi:hypothetical protein
MRTIEADYLVVGAEPTMYRCAIVSEAELARRGESTTWCEWDT